LLCILAGVLTYALLATVEFVTVFAKEASSVHERQEEENNQLQAELDAARSEFGTH